MAGWATATGRTSCCPRRSRRWRGITFVGVSAGGGYILALTADSSVWSWGYGGFGQLGQGDEQNQSLPTKVEAFAGQRVVAMSAGDCHSLAITADGSAWSWGHGYYGKLGHGDCQQQFLPKKIEAFAGRRVLAVEERTASPSPPMALSGAGAMDFVAWAMATSRPSRCPRRLMP